MNHYCNTPHQTIAELLQLAYNRARGGEQWDKVANDMIEGYGLGHGSTNAHNITRAAQFGEQGHIYHTQKQQNDFYLLLA